MDTYELKIDNVYDLASFINKDYATVMELTESGLIIKKYEVEIKEVDLENDYLFVIVDSNISAFTPFRRVVVNPSVNRYK